MTQPRGQNVPLDPARRTIPCIRRTIRSQIPIVLDERQHAGVHVLSLYALPARVLQRRGSIMDRAVAQSHGDAGNDIPSHGYKHDGRRTRWV